MEMTQLEVFAAKPENLSSMSWKHVVEGENTISHVSLCPSYVYIVHEYRHTYTQDKLTKENTSFTCPRHCSIDKVLKTQAST